jgi:hypothetical protein
MTKRSPLAVFPSVCHGRIGSPNVANAVNHSAKPVRFDCDAVPHALFNAVRRLIGDAMPLDLYIVLSRGAPSQEYDKQIAHVGIIHA